MLEFGTIEEIKEDKALATVNILGRTTDWLPILSTANSFKKHFIPLRVGQQVAVLEDRLILGSLFNKGCSEPSANNSKEAFTYEDGTTISYDSKNGILDIDAVDTINITCKNLNLSTSTTSFIGGSINHDGIVIDKTHTHTQNSGNHFGAGATTTPPN